MTSEEQRNLDAPKRWDEFYNNRPTEYVDACCASDYRNRFFPNAGGWPEVSGIEGLREAAQHILDILPDRRMTVEGMMAGGGAVALEVQFSGTVAQDAPNLPPVGTQIQIPLCVVLRFRDGLIVQESIYGL